MSQKQRLAFLAIAAVFAVVAVLIMVAGGDDDDDPPRAATTATATTEVGGATGAGTTDSATTTQPGATTVETTGGVKAPAEAAPPATPDLPVLEAGEETRVEVDKGDRVRFLVRSGVADEVHVHGYDISKDVAAGGEVEFSFTADITGIFEIELENAGEPLGELVVNP